MQDFAQQMVSGLATGSIFASTALALVLIYRSMNVVNFAQGEMAMLATFVAWQLVRMGTPLWLAFALAFASAVALERAIVRPIERKAPLTIVIVTLGLLSICNGVAGWIWGYEVNAFPSLFPASTIAIGSVRVGTPTKLGLAMRAAASYPESSRALGIPVSAMLALGWGLAGAVGAISGMMIAPIVLGC